MATSGHVDVVVVGAGLAGLAAAVTASQAGRRVLVLEQGWGPGGYAVTFQRPPFRFDASLHALDGAAPGGGTDTLLRRLGVLDRVRLTRLDPLYLVRSPRGDLSVPADPMEHEARLVAAFPAERDGIRAWFDDAYAVLVEGRRMRADARASDPPDRAAFAQRYPTTVRLSPQTWQEATAARVADPDARALLMTLWAYTSTPPSRLSALLGMGLAGSYTHFGGWYPHGGSSAIPAALVDVLTEQGGSLKCQQTVTTLETRDDRVVAVHTAAGVTVTCDAVVSTAAAPTLASLLPQRALPEQYQQRLQGPSVAASNVTVFLGLERDVFAEHGLPHEVVLSPGLDHDAEFAAGMAGRWEQTGVLATDYTRVDPGCAPEGGGVVALTAVAAYDHADTWGQDDADAAASVKHEVGARLLAVADSAIPGLAAAVAYQEVATPRTNARYTLNTGGSWAGYESRPEVTGPGALGAATPLPNLVLAGSWTGSFGESPALASGVRAARLVERVLTEQR